MRQTILNIKTVQQRCTAPAPAPATDGGCNSSTYVARRTYTAGSNMGPLSGWVGTNDSEAIMAVASAANPVARIDPM